MTSFFVYISIRLSRQPSINTFNLMWGFVACVVRATKSDRRYFTLKITANGTRDFSFQEAAG